MSEIRIYSLLWLQSAGQISDCPKGDYVPYEDVQKLEQKVQELESENSELVIEWFDKYGIKQTGVIKVAQAAQTISQLMTQTNEMQAKLDKIRKMTER